MPSAASLASSTWPMPPRNVTRRELCGAALDALGPGGRGRTPLTPEIASEVFTQIADRFEEFAVLAAESAELVRRSQATWEALVEPIGVLRSNGFSWAWIASALSMDTSDLFRRMRLVHAATGVDPHSETRGPREPPG